MKHEPVRLAEILASMSLATDLGMGLPEEHVLRQTVIAARLAKLAGFDDDVRADTFYVSLLAWVGCLADSHELATWFGDDRQIRADSYGVDRRPLTMMPFMLSHVGSGLPPAQRMAMLGRFMIGGIRDAMGTFTTHCQTTGDIADRFGMHEAVRRSLAQAFERWDGKGIPGVVAADRLEPAIRVVQIADDTEVFVRSGGVEAAVSALRSGSGREFDPALVDLAVQHAGELFAGLEDIDTWSVVIAGCAPLDRPLTDPELTSALETLADYADLKSPWYLGHSRAVGALAHRAAAASGAVDADLVKQAGLVHRLGAIGVSSSVWNKVSPWSASERERVRTVPYLTERVLSRQPTLAKIGRLASMTHERLDGSGYPRGLSATSLDGPARLLAAADCYQELAEERPGRAALLPVDRAAALQAEVRAGRLDAAAVEAVLQAAGHRVPRRVPQVAALTTREVEVLALLVRGLSTKDIARRLTISPRTVTAHLEHIYAKTGTSSRGAASMFALRHGLVSAE
ncbi:HD domain-containing phosphohydrolase [Flexivirga alba]|uniref:HD domain-containing phosphohydrolase n=1 Tax=Flexivirga alba TaxID=702742 RepID=A0ABW2AH32_9MICO